MLTRRRQLSTISVVSRQNRSSDICAPISCMVTYKIIKSVHRGFAAAWVMGIPYFPYQDIEETGLNCQRDTQRHPIIPWAHIWSWQFSGDIALEIVSVILMKESGNGPYLSFHFQDYLALLPLIDQHCTPEQVKIYGEATVSSLENSSQRQQAFTLRQWHGAQTMGYCFRLSVSKEGRVYCIV